MPATSPGTTDLVFWRDHDEASGDALDAHGSHDGTDVNTCGSRTKNSHQGRDHIAANLEHFDTSDHADLSPSGNVTWGVWVNPDSVATKGVIAKGLRFNGAGGEWEMFTLAGGGTMKAYYVVRNAANTASQNIISTATFGADSWSLILFGWDDDNDELRVSVNGGAFQTVSYSGGIYDGTGTLSVGRLTGVGGFDFDGVTGPVFMYAAALSDDNASWLWNSGSPTAYADLSSTPLDLEPSAGDLALDGGSAALALPMDLGATAGDLGLDGSATLALGMDLGAQAGDLGLDGASADLGLGMDLGPGAGAVALDGSATLGLQMDLGPSAGGVTLSGTATLILGLDLSAGSGSLDLTGSASLALGMDLAGQGGVLTLAGTGTIVVPQPPVDAGFALATAGRRSVSGRVDSNQATEALGSTGTALRSSSTMPARRRTR